MQKIFPQRKNLKKNPPCFKKILPKKEVFLLTHHGNAKRPVWEKETRINIDSTSIHIASSLSALAIVLGLGYWD